MKIKDHIFQPSIKRSMMLMAFVSLVESTQLLIIVMLVFSFIPIPLTDFAKDLFPFVLNSDVHPNRRMFFLHLWVGAGLLVHAAGLWFLRGRLGQARTDGLLGRLILVDGAWLVMQLFLVFKMIVYPQAAWVKPVFYVSLVTSLLSRFFWVEVNAFLLKTDEILLRWSSQKKLRWGLDIIIVLFMALALWIVDQQRLWAVIDLAGSRALADQGWMALSPLIKSSYAQALPLLIVLSMAYYVFFYLLLRQLFGSILLAGCGMILAVKWQYFHLGVAPDIWQFPLKTVVPLLPDVFFWSCLLMHVRQKQGRRWLGLSCVVLGAYMAYHFPTGIWLWMGWASYLALMREKHAWYWAPWGLASGLWLVCCGPQGTLGLVHHYWSSLLQILQGVGGLPYYDCLRGRNFFAFSVQFIIPVIYFVTIIAFRVVSLRGAEATKQSFKGIAAHLMVPISIYGLGLFTLHVWQPSLSNYYSVSSPLVIVLCFWASQALALLSDSRRIILSSLFLIVYAGALLTNNLFGIYPNVWNMAGVNWAQVKAMDHQRL